MIIRTGNTIAQIAAASEEELNWLVEYLSFEDKGAFFKTRRMPAWKKKEMSRVRMVSEIARSFPAGFVPVVQRAGAAAGITVEVVDTRKMPVPMCPNPLIDWLRDYQCEAVEAARKHHRGIFYHATGAGKTEIMAALGELYEGRWLILSHKVDLLYQISERFARRTGEEVGFIHGGFAPKRITLSSFQTMHGLIVKRDKRTLAFLETVQGVMIDECHIVGSSTFYKVVMALKNAYFRYGFSGTPFSRSDQKSIYIWGALGEVIHTIRSKQLVDEGVLAKPRINLVNFTHSKSNTASTWNAVYDSAIVHNPLRNALVMHVVEKLAKKPALLFVKAIEHGKILHNALHARGVKSEFVWGAKSIHVRRAAIQRLVHGDVDVIVCNVVFQEGIDIPELQSIVMAAGLKSAIMVLQNVGRGMRKHDMEGQITKETFEVFDIHDLGCGCDTPRKHRGCKWVETHSRARSRHYTKEKYGTTIDNDTQGFVALKQRKH